MAEQILEGEYILNNIRKIQMTDLKSMLELLNWLNPSQFELHAGLTQEGKQIYELTYKSENRES